MVYRLRNTPGSPLFLISFSLSHIFPSHIPSHFLPSFIPLLHSLPLFSFHSYITLAVFVFPFSPLLLFVLSLRTFPSLSLPPFLPFWHLSLPSLRSSPSCGRVESCLWEHIGLVIGHGRDAPPLPLATSVITYGASW